MARPPARPAGCRRRTRAELHDDGGGLFCQPSRGAVSRLMESMAADEDFEPNQDSSFSEDELVPPRSTGASESSSAPGQYTLTHTHTCPLLLADVASNSRHSLPVSLCSAPVQCVLDNDSLVDGLRVLIPMDDQLLYAGHVNTVHSPDM